MICDSNDPGSSLSGSGTYVWIDTKRISYEMEIIDVHLSDDIFEIFAKIEIC